MGVLIGLMVSEVQTYLDYREKQTKTELSEKDKSSTTNSEYLKWKINWTKIIFYVIFLLLIWVFSNLYLHFTIK